MQWALVVSMGAHFGSPRSLAFRKTHDLATVCIQEYFRALGTCPVGLMPRFSKTIMDSLFEAHPRQDTYCTYFEFLTLLAIGPKRAHGDQKKT